ncbi:MAG: hypothetical protein M3516_06615 [Actinomycetota bacterium]|nr:hypothetical protein [Actinomycetota bacterium]
MWKRLLGAMLVLDVAAAGLFAVYVERRESPAAASPASDPIPCPTPVDTVDPLASPTPLSTSTLASPTPLTTIPISPTPFECPSPQITIALVSPSPALPSMEPSPSLAPSASALVHADTP